VMIELSVFYSLSNGDKLLVKRDNYLASLFLLTFDQYKLKGYDLIFFKYFSFNNLSR